MNLGLGKVEEWLNMAVNSRKSFRQEPGGQCMKPIRGYPPTISTLSHVASWTQFKWGSWQNEASVELRAYTDNTFSHPRYPDSLWRKGADGCPTSLCHLSKYPDRIPGFKATVLDQLYKVSAIVGIDFAPHVRTNPCASSGQLSIQPGTSITSLRIIVFFFLFCVFRAEAHNSRFLYRWKQLSGGHPAFRKRGHMSSC